jgi:periplasmic protein TonB
MSGAARSKTADVAFASSVRGRQMAEDPWRAVFSLGDRAMKIGWVVGLLLAVGTHGFASARAMLALYDMQRGVDAMRLSIHEFLWTEYDVDLKPEEKKVEPEQKKDEPPPPEPEPDPSPLPAPKAAEPQKDPYEEPKAAPVQAAKILTAPDDPNKVEDLTDQGIVSGDNTAGPLGGQSSAVGTSNAITHNAAVSNTGKPGGTGTADAAPPPPPKVDLSKPAGIIGGASWSNCPFPDEADTDQIDFAQVTLIVTVRPDGSPQSVQVTSDPGHGFGRAARMCALARKYNAGLDRDGNATTMSTPPIRVTFSR